MAVSAKIVTIAAFSLLLVGGARAQQTQAAAAPSDRCEGTLCDLYYSGRGSAPDAGAAKPAATPTSTTPGVPAGATVLTAPTGNPFSRLFGGGSSGGGGNSWFGGSGNRTPPPDSEPASATNGYMHMGSGGLLGGGNQRCSGTLCDAYYGSSPAEPAPAPQQQAAVGGYVAAAVADAPAVPHRHIVHESETRPKCSSPNADPWRCYR